MTDINVPAHTTPAHLISARATPQAIVHLLAVLNVTECAPTPEGGAMWRLQGGLIVTLRFDEPDVIWTLRRFDQEEPA